ncbi:MAG: hypothetical protein CVT88_09195 [Candidatus Altiarchaeales archaeon HGW-Altiarchaeales-1]|nr:MAG: hypothetical protein CVT88_09195 [Candidatus Altiarchaeales archaeon HGW-Altiarchaeales-1]
MEKKKVNNFVIGFIVIVVLISTYLILNHNAEIEHSNTTNSSVNIVNSSIEKYVDFTENVKENAKEINFTISEHNIKPQFKVGDKFKYTIHGSSLNPKNNSADINGILECNVEKLERINGKDCYLLVSKTQTSLPDNSPLKAILSETKHWVDKDTGKIIKTSIQESMIQQKGKVIEMPSSEATIPNETSDIYGNIMYYPWMLALDDNFEMKVNENSQGIKTSFVSVFKVIGKEKINDRDCFKVELRVLDENKHVLLRENIWVDIKKRVLVKAETYSENLKVGEVNLIDYSSI